MKDSRFRCKNCNELIVFSEHIGWYHIDEDGHRRDCFPCRRPAFAGDDLGSSELPYRAVKRNYPGGGVGKSVLNIPSELGICNTAEPSTPATTGVGYDAIEEMRGIELIAAERKRQIGAEGWSTARDDEHRNYELSTAARGYLLAAEAPHNFILPPTSWPWDKSWWKPSPEPIRNLVKAAALIAAEIDRLQRIKETQDGK
jgi:hypothetical protein